MSLVAYDSSDGDSDNENTPETITANNIDNNTSAIISMQTTSKLSLPTPKTVSQDVENENEENSNIEELKNLLGTLPKCRDSKSAENIEEDNDIPLKTEIESNSTKYPKKRTVKITIPSLSEFKDLEEEEEGEKKPVKVVQPSMKGCGLFDILTPTKVSQNKKILIPDAVKKATVKRSTQQPGITKKSSINRINSSEVKKSIINKSYEVNSDDEEDTVIDFFGLTTSKNISDNVSTNSPESTLSFESSVCKTNSEKISSTKEEHSTICDSSLINSDILTDDQLNNPNKTLTSNVMNLPKEEILLKNKAEVGPKLPVPEQEYNVDVEGNVAFDEKAIEYLCGRRSVKRKNKEIDEANIIEINGEDIKPDEREWLVKALTEETSHKPASMHNFGVNSQSKRKHQITYLAHQAKAMELELKNQWSQNKMARQQTRSKYGF